MSLLDNISIEDNRVDSVEVLATNVDLSKDKEYDYKYWLFTEFDNNYIHSEQYEEKFCDCFESCPQIHNYDLEYCERDPDETAGIPVWLGDLKWPHVRIMFNLKHENATAVVQFMSRLFAFLEEHINVNWRFEGIKSITIVNWRAETYRNYPRYDYTKYKRIDNYLSSECKEDDILKPFGIVLEAGDESIEKLTLWRNNRKFLHELRETNGGRLRIVVNYAVRNMMSSAQPDIIPIIIYGRNYTDLAVRMTYIECVGFEQMTEPGGYDEKDYYDGWKYVMFEPMPKLGEMEYAHYVDYNKVSRFSRFCDNEYSYAYRLMFKMAKNYNNNDIDSFALRMTLPNVIGRMAKKCKWRKDPKHLAMELFFKVNTLNVDAVLKKAAKKQKRINNVMI